MYTILKMFHAIPCFFPHFSQQKLLLHVLWQVKQEISITIQGVWTLQHHKTRILQHKNLLMQTKSSLTAKARQHHRKSLYKIKTMDWSFCLISQAIIEKCFRACAICRVAWLQMVITCIFEKKLPVDQWIFTLQKPSTSLHRKVTQTQLAERRNLCILTAPGAKMQL